MDANQLTILLGLISAMSISLILIKANQNFASPTLAIINRWLRWVVIAGGFAELFLLFGWSQRPYWVLFVASILGWFLLESIYHWMAIHAMSVSPLPLFPRFILNQAGDEWPVQPRFLRLRDEIRAAGFKHIQALRAEVSTSLYVRASFYHSADGLTRLQITFLPQPMGNLMTCYHLASQTTEGVRIVTDNHHLPFAGFYPENWLVERRPWSRSLSALQQRHQNRVIQARGTLVPWTSEPLNDINAQQTNLEQLNTELGFLLPGSEHDEHGRISAPGRYRLWKEILSLNYLGLAARYQ